MSFYTDDCLTGAEAIARAKATRRYFESLRTPVAPPLPSVKTVPPMPLPPSPPAVPKRIRPIKEPAVTAKPPVGPLFDEVHPRIKFVPLQAIIQATCAYFSLTETELLSRQRRAPIVFARQVCTYVALQTTVLSTAEIARRLMRGDHSSALHSRDRIKSWLQDGRPNVVEAVKRIMGDIRRAFPSAGEPPVRVRLNPQPDERHRNTNRPYSDEEVGYLIRRWVKDRATIVTISQEMGRTPAAIFRKRKQLGLRRENPKAA